MTELFPAIVNAWTLHRAWPRAELVIVDDAGHADEAITREQDSGAATDGNHWVQGLWRHGVIGATGRFLDSCRR